MKKEKDVVGQICGKGDSAPKSQLTGRLGRRNCRRSGIQNRIRICLLNTGHDGRLSRRNCRNLHNFVEQFELVTTDHSALCREPRPRRHRRCFCRWLRSFPSDRRSPRSRWLRWRFFGFVHHVLVAGTELTAGVETNDVDDGLRIGSLLLLCDTGLFQKYLPFLWQALGTLNGNVG